jgi:phosphoribosylaminoimidazole (AIR) synthetase
MDDLQCFVRGFHTKLVVDVQKLTEVGDLIIVMRSSALHGALNHLV